MNILLHTQLIVCATVDSQYLEDLECITLGTGMIGEELSAESELGQQSVSLCDDSGNNSVFFHEAQGNLLKGIDNNTVRRFRRLPSLQARTLRI